MQRAICCRIFTPAARSEYPAASLRDYCCGALTRSLAGHRGSAQTLHRKRMPKLSRRRRIRCLLIGKCSSHQDSEAAWSGHRSRRAIHGFKAHVGADAETAIVEELSVTPGNVHDGRAGHSALPDNPGDVYADSAYRGQVFASAVLAKVGLRWSYKPAFGGVQATIRCASSEAGIIACSAFVAALRRSLEPGNAAMVCGECDGEGWPRRPSRSASPRSLTT